jgi:hypothetical protein
MVSVQTLTVKGGREGVRGSRKHNKNIVKTKEKHSKEAEIQGKHSI